MNHRRAKTDRLIIMLPAAHAPVLVIASDGSRERQQIDFAVIALYQVIIHLTYTAEFPPSNLRIHPDREGSLGTN